MKLYITNWSMMKIHFFFFAKQDSSLVLCIVFSLKGLWSENDPFMPELFWPFLFLSADQVIVFSWLVIYTADSYMLQQFHNCFCVSVKRRIVNNLYVFSLARPCTIEKKLVIFFPEMIKTCPLMNKFEKKESGRGHFLVYLWPFWKPCKMLTPPQVSHFSRISIIIFAS